MITSPEQRGISWRRRSILAFVIAPISLGLLALPFPSGAWALMFSASVGYPIALVVGVPLFLISNTLGWTSIWAYALFAFVCAAILVAGFIFMPALSQGDTIGEILSSEARWAQAFVAIAVSALSVGVFWIIARPDRK